MTMPLKPRVAKTITRIDRNTVAVTAGVNFEDIGLRIEGNGSEVYDYDVKIAIHSSSNTSALFEGTLNNLTSYSYDSMRGTASTPSAGITTRSSFFCGRVATASYPAMSEFRITGYVGNKRHIDGLSCYDTGSRSISKTSFYTADTSTELTSLQLYSSATATITYTLIITAVPKIQYNPHAILLENLTLTNQTADIIFGGVNDTEGVDDLDGDKYDYVTVSSGFDGTASITCHINEVVTGDKVLQQMRNTNGTISSNNATGVTYDHLIDGNNTVLINPDTGRKKISTGSNNKLVSRQQIERYTSNPDTSAPMTSLLLRPSASVSGNIQLYAVPKDRNADLTPWEFRQEFPINGDFSAGISAEIPPWALMMKVDFVGEGTSSFNMIEIDFNNLGISNNWQFLESSTSSTISNFLTGENRLGNVLKTSSFESLISLKAGANRPILSKFNSNENTINILGMWVPDSSTVWTSAQLSAFNTNAINGLLTVSFY